MPLQHLSLTRQEILLEILRRGKTSVHELAQTLNFTLGAVRQQLLALHGEGLVSHQPVAKGPGRPRYIYELTPAGRALFRPDYGETVRRLARQLEQEAPDVLDSFFSHEFDMQYQKLDLLPGERGRFSEARVESVAECLEERGFLPEFDLNHAGGFTLTLRNCPYSDFAEGSRRICQLSFESLKRALPGFSVERTKWRAQGTVCCAYNLLPEIPGPEPSHSR